MRRKVTWVTPVFLAVVIATAFTALPRAWAASGEEAATDQSTADGSAEEQGQDTHDAVAGPGLAPRVIPAAPSVYDSMPTESLTTCVATVNGDPISVRLFERRLARSRSLAFGYFGTRYGAVVDADFWTTPYEGEVPAEWLKQRMLEECVRIKIELGLAKESGVIEDTGYAALLQALDLENQRRREALAVGEPIYGPQQYREDEFFLYVMNNLRIAVEKRLWQGRLQASEETLRAHYEAMRDAHYDRGDRVRVWGIQIQYGARGGYREALTRDEARARIEGAQERLEQGELFEEVASEYNEDGGLNEEVFDFESRSGDRSHRAGRRAVAMELDEGETSEVFEDMSAFFILKCVEREALGYAPYEEVEGSVRRHYLHETYEGLIGDLVEGARVEVDQAVLEGIQVR